MLLGLSVSFHSAFAADAVLREARITQVIKDVKLLPGQAAPRPASVSDMVRGDTAVRTGAESRAELTFGDLTIARLGANTIFSFNADTRTVDLAGGAILLRVPKNSGGAKIQTAAVTAAITGTTVMVEYHRDSYAKYLVLEGTMRVYLKGQLGESILMHAGQMMILNPNAHRLSEVLDFDLERLMRTALLLEPPIGSESLIAEAQHAQLEKKAAGELIDTNLVIFGRGTLVTLTDPQSTDVIDRKTAAAPPTPTPGKVGRPPVIANSVGYRVDGASAIQTDPAITSPGRTDFGKIYRGAGADGNFSTWSFDTTRTFDTSSGFDAFYTNAGVPVAAFKFQSLVLAGNPAISTANGGASFLELIGVNGITSGPPGGPLTFAGIDNLLLATQNGSIILGPEISFQNIPALFFYARGTGSNIVLGSPITGTRDLYLDAEGSVQVNGAETITNFRAVTGTDFLAGTGAVNASTIDIRSGGNLNFNLSQFAVGGAVGGTVILNAGGATNIDARGDQTVFNNASSVAVTGQTINILGNSPTTLDFRLARAANFNAGAGGFQASTVAFNGASLLNITSGADINLFSLSSAANVTAATSISAINDLTAVGTITAGTTINVGGTLGTNFSSIIAGQSITSGGDLNGGTVRAGTFIDVGGNVAAGQVTAETDIRVTGNLSPIFGVSAIRGAIRVGGNLGTTGSVTAGTTINVNGNFSVTNTTAGQDITVGGNLTAQTLVRAGTTLNVGGTLNARTSSAGQSITTGADLISSLQVSAGSFIDVGGKIDANIITAGTSIRTTGNLTAQFLLMAGTTLNVGGTLNAPTISAGQSITSGADLISSTRVTAGSFIDVGGKMDANVVTAGTSIRTTGNFTATTSATAGTTINVGGTFRAPTAIAGGDISANRITLLNVTTPGVLRAGAGGITPFISVPAANLIHSFTVSSIVASGGIDFSGDNFVAAGDGKDGGRLSIFANTITFDAANIASANFNGASGVPTNSAGGSGGQFTITSTGAITLNAPIQATTGFNAASVPFGGTGGTVALTSSAGAINVNSSILVSSNDPNGPGPLRRSAAGGTLSLTSGLTSGNAITFGAGTQLLSLLNASAPGPAGQITITSAGGNIIDNGATIQADRGTITIQHSGAPAIGTAQITLNGGTIQSETLLASSRGDLTIGTTTPVNLADVTISLLATNNFSWNGGTLVATASASSGNVTVQAGNDISITGGVDIERFNGGITDGLNLRLDAGRNLQIGNGLTLVTNGGGLTSGADITVRSGLAMTIGGFVNLQTRPGGGNQGNGSNITIDAKGPITMAGLSGTVQIGAARTLSTGGNISLLGTGSYTATSGEGGINFLVDNSSPGIIGTGGNITLQVAGDLITGGGGRMDLVINNSNGGRIQTGGNIFGSIGGNLRTVLLNVQIDNRFKGFIGAGAGLTFNVNGTLTSGSDANFTILNSDLAAGSGGTIGSSAFIKVTLADANIGRDLNAYINNSDGSIGGVVGSVTLQINGKLTVTGRVDVFGTLNSTGTITAGQLSGTNVITPAGIQVGTGGITRFTFPSGFPPPVFHTITAGSLSSTGGINFNGANFGTLGGLGPFDGGQLTINVPSLTFGPSAADNIQGPLTLNGGDGDATHAAGSGGSLTVNTTGDITVNSPISATSGQRETSLFPTGDGGTVSLNSTAGVVAVTQRIQVSSADPAGSAGTLRRRSNRGGNINLTSNRAVPAGSGGLAININNSGQLLSLLDAAAPGPGGKITILATGANSTIAVNPAGGVAPTDTIRADRGSVDIRHTGNGGQISLTNANIRADIVKVGALGDNGVLNIGGGTITADSTLKLYSPGSNGQINFIADVTLGGAGAKIIAGNAITIFDRVTVTIGGANPASIFVNNDAKGTPQANYSGFGGNGFTSGTFAGAGATNPQPLSSAPAFGPPGGP
ncbi:MAG: hypothetical protein QOF24_86 [Verrucomicrobiota bacterium]